MLGNLAESFVDEMKQAGAALVGFADLRSLEPRPFPKLTTGVALAVPFADLSLARLPGAPEADPAYVEAYRRSGQSLDPLVTRGVELLRAAGYAAWGYGREIFFDRSGGDMNPSAYLCAFYQHKSTATLAGLGWIGRMGVLVTPDRGPHVWLATLVTDAPLPLAEAVNESRCGSCRKCQEACPVGAVKGPAWQRGMARDELIDIQKCQAHRRERGQNAGLPMCGLCLAACPFGGEFLR
ncbi:MAG: 4Fe-4S binding protein [Candidatus Adiutrix sp.]|nr:4Fe-4S binding protein [Candidatus Adiutrix sp.]